MLKIRGGEARALGLIKVGPKSALDQKLRQERVEAKANTKAALKQEIERYNRLVSFT